jgi:prophage regulatory protein
MFIFYKEICSTTGKSRSTIWRWVRSGHFPEPVKLGPNTVAWTQAQLDAWVATKCKGGAA